MDGKTVNMEMRLYEPEKGMKTNGCRRFGKPACIKLPQPKQQKRNTPCYYRGYCAYKNKLPKEVNLPIGLVFGCGILP